MAWDFSTDPAYQEKLDWAATFVRTEIEPLDLVYPHRQLHTQPAELKALLAPLKAAVREQGLWATHLGPELGGPGFGQLKLALLNEVLGRSFWAPTVFGTQAPDTGNAEILAHYGTAAQKARFLQPLLDGEIFSCYSMTEPQGGSDPGEFRTTAVPDGDGLDPRRLEVLLIERGERGVLHRPRRHGSRRRPVATHVDVPRRSRCARTAHRAQPRSRRRPR